MMKHAMILVLAGVALGGPALGADEPAKAPPSCVAVRSIDNWKEIDDEHAYIYTSPRAKYKVTFFAPCRELKWAVFARLDTRGGHMCLQPGDALIFGRGSPFGRDQLGIDERCVITKIEPVPFDEKEQVPAKPAAP